MSDSNPGTTPDPTPSATPEPAPNSLTRRRFLQAGAVGAVSAIGLAALGKSVASVGKPEALPMRYASANKTQLSLYGLFFIPSELAAAREIINDFNAQSKTIFVQYVQSSWGAIGTKMTAAFSSGDVPDLFQYYDAGLVPWAANGLLADLKKLHARQYLGQGRARHPQRADHLERRRDRPPVRDGDPSYLLPHGPAGKGRA